MFVDGIHHPGLSTADAPTLAAAVDLPHDAHGRALGQVATDGFGALNLAFLRDGAVVRAESGVLHLVHVSTGEQRLTAVRHLVTVPGGAEVELYEHFLTLGEGPALTTAATEVHVGEGARVHHARVLDESPVSLHVGGVGARVEAGGHYRLGSLVLGARLARIEAYVTLADRNAAADLSGLALLRDRQHADHHVQVDHASPDCRSDQVFRAVVDDRAQSVYTGAVIVRRGASGTDSHQLHNARSSPMMPSRTPGLGSRSTTTTSSAPTVRRSGASTRTPCSTCASVG